MRPNTDKMINFVMESLPKIEPAQGKDIMLVIGNTGAGKSTLINYLLGCEMEERRVRGRIHAFPKEPAKELAQIGHTEESETFFPAVYKGKYNTQEFIFCDCPGFLDTRTIEERTLVHINMQLVIMAASSLKVIIAIDINSILTDKGLGLKKLIQTLATLLKNAKDEIINSIVFAITRINNNETKEELMESLDQLIFSYKNTYKNLPAHQTKITLKQMKIFLY